MIDKSLRKAYDELLDQLQVILHSGGLGDLEGFMAGVSDPQMRRSIIDGGFLMACRYPNREHILYFVGLQADLHAKTKQGFTGLMAAVEDSTLAVTQLLIKLGVPVDAENELRDTALMIAASKGFCDKARLLIEAGANVNTRSKRQFTPLMPAALRNDYKMAALLLENGAEVNAQNDFGFTALHILLGNKHFDARLLHYFLHKGADVLLPNKHSKTPLQLLGCELTQLHDYVDHLVAEQERRQGYAEDISAVLESLRHATQQELPDLLLSHFMPWLRTPACRQIFQRLMSVVQECRVEDGGFTLIFAARDQHGTPIAAYFGPPAKRVGHTALDIMARRHGQVVIGDREAYAESVFFPAEVYDPDDNEQGLERFEPFCDAGQNWFVFDTLTLNADGEAVICLWEHGTGLNKAKAYPGQQQNAYSPGGFLFRVLAQRIWPEDEAFKPFSYG